MGKYEETNDMGSIAIIGMAGRFPGAGDMNEFWRNLYNGVESVRFFSREELIQMGIERHLLENPRFVAADAVLEGMDMFDAEFFGYSAREAEIMDPQHRLFLESAWEVLESAGYNSELYDGRVAVYAGANMSGYMIRNLYSNPGLVENIGTFKIMLANGQDFFATKVSYNMNLMGPSVNVNTLCSSSMVAVHYACKNLLDYGCDIALAGGVSFQVSRNEAFFYQEGGIGSSDGHCRAFDAKANGTVSGSGLAVVVLKRLEDAVADGDYIHAVIKGTGINNDGSSKNSYTAPNVDGQAECIAEAIAMSGVDPETITYIDAHGTGTNLGDPIEIAALTKAFRAYTDKKQYCGIGSVKTNIGHLVNAGGLASLVKTVLAMKHGVIPPSLNFEEPNPKIDFANSPFYVNTKRSAWETDGYPKRAGISSFGIGGTNTHVILEEAPAPEPSSVTNRPWQLITLSAKTETALDKITNNLAGYAKNNPEASLADIAFTLHVGRRSFNHRRMFVCREMEDLAQKLEELPQDKVFTYFYKPKEQQAAFVFPGEDCCFENMGLELYNTEPVYRDNIDRCSKMLEPILGMDIRKIIYPAGLQAQADGRLHDAAVSRAAVFITEYALAKLLEEWEIVPWFVTGEGVGEYTAACLAGVFSPEDALYLVSADEDSLAERLKEVSFNTPRITFIPGIKSNRTGSDIAAGPEYWVKQRDSARSTHGLNKILEDTDRIIMEIGPGNHLCRKAERKAGFEGRQPIIPTKPGSCEGKPDTFVLLEAVGRFWLAGGRVNWNKLYVNEKRHRIPLPTYPFERKRYWIGAAKRKDGMVERNDTGKNNLNKSPRAQLSTPYTAPENDVQKTIAEVCQEILGYDLIGIHDDFFELGGHSLLAVAIISRLRKIFKKDISMENFFGNTTIAKLAAVFGENTENGFEECNDFEEGRL